MKKIFIPGSYLLIVALLLSGCSSGIATSTIPVSTATQAILPVIPFTQTPPATETSIPSTPTLTPTPVPSPLPLTPTMTPDHVLTLNPGRTQLSVDGILEKSNRNTYRVNAKANQYLMAAINTTDQDLALEIAAPDQSLLLKGSDKQQSWQGKLPVDGEYQVSVISTSIPGDYNISISLPVEVLFNLGTPSLILDGTVDAHQVSTYLVNGEKNQTLHVIISAPNNDIFLTIYGLQDGQPYIRSMTGSNTADIKLPISQIYVIQCVSNGDADENFQITFTIK